MNTLITCYFTSVIDPQSGNQWQPNHEDLHTLIQSLNGERLIVLNDCFEGMTIDNVTYVPTVANINPYFQRWVSIWQYLRDNPEIENLFCIDATDVEVLKSPFKEKLGNKLYLGDEIGKLNSGWMIREHPTKLIKNFLRNNSNKRILNAGICGGKRDLVMSFIHKIFSVYFDLIYLRFYKKEKNIEHSDMGIFNYVGYTFFNDKIVHGSKVNTEFKKFEYNDISWFKHK